MLDIYRDYVNQLREARRADSGQFDKTVIAIASGGLALSLTFIKGFVSYQTACLMPCLKWAWVLFTTTLLTTLIALYFSPFEIDRQMLLTEEYFILGNKTAFRKKNPWTKALKILNLISLFTLIVAVVLVLLFVGHNLKP